MVLKFGPYLDGEKTHQTINKYLIRIKHKFEKLHTKVCRNILGVHKNSTELMVKAELGRYPLMMNILANISGYWQHVLCSPKSSLLYTTIKHFISLKSPGINFVTRMRSLLMQSTCKVYLS